MGYMRQTEGKREKDLHSTTAPQSEVKKMNCTRYTSELVQRLTGERGNKVNWGGGGEELFVTGHDTTHENTQCQLASQKPRAREVAEMQAGRRCLECATEICQQTPHSSLRVAYIPGRSGRGTGNPEGGGVGVGWEGGREESSECDSNIDKKFTSKLDIQYCMQVRDAQHFQQSLT